MQTRQHNSGDVSSGDVGYSKPFFRDKCKAKAQRQRQNRNSPCVGIALVDKFEHLVDDKADDNRQGEKRHRAEQYPAGLSIGVLKADYKGEHQNSDYIVNNCGAEDSCAELGFELAHLLKRFDGNADARCGHNYADKHSGEKLFGAPRRKAVNRHIQQSSAGKRYGYAHAGDCESLWAGFHQRL